jgi:hypothetical protein
MCFSGRVLETRVSFALMALAAARPVAIRVGHGRARSGPARADDPQAVRSSGPASLSAQKVTIAHGQRAALLCWVSLNLGLS